MTIGVCFFCAVTSIAALFIFGGQNMKKWTTIIMVMALLMMMCSCRLEYNSNDLPSIDNNNGEKDTSTTITTAATVGKTTNPLAGVWVARVNNPQEVMSLFVFNDDYTIYGLMEGVSHVNYKNAVEFLVQGTYEIVSDNEIIIKGYDEHGEYMEDSSDYLLEDGNLIIDNGMILERFSPCTNYSGSIVGIWKVYDNDTFSFNMGGTYSIIDNIAFYNDGSYTTNPAYNYGQYSIVQDGNAVQIYSSDARYEELIKIKFLGCGLMVFDGPTGAYVLQHAENN